jgi:DNA-binding FadR family transcriptional regulator
MRLDDRPPSLNRRDDFADEKRDAWRQWVPLHFAPGNARSPGYDEHADMAALASCAGLVLSHKHASLADVFVASASFLPPSLLQLVRRHEKAACSLLKAIVAAERVHAKGLTGLLRTELAFQEAVVDALGSETLIVLMDMLHEIIDCAASHLNERPSSAPRHLAEVKTHHEIVRLVEAGHGDEAAALMRVRTSEVEDVIREYDGSALVSGRRVDSGKHLGSVSFTRHHLC